MRARSYLAAATIVAGLAGVAAATKTAPRLEPFPMPPPEVADGAVELDLPNVPPLDLPPDANSPGALRRGGATTLDAEVVVTGFVTWVYDCARVVGEPGSTRAQRRRIAAAEPERCLRPNLLIGDVEGAPPAKSLWVIEATKGFHVGDRVTVRGRWAPRSPSGIPTVTWSGQE